jgi:hypothetical protein
VEGKIYSFPITVPSLCFIDAILCSTALKLATMSSYKAFDSFVSSLQRFNENEISNLIAFYRSFNRRFPWWSFSLQSFPWHWEGKTLQISHEFSKELFTSTAEV